MIATIVSGGVKAVIWSLAALGLATLALAGMVAWPLRQPPEPSKRMFMNAAE